MSAPDQPTCWQLIERAARGAETEREEFSRRYLPTVREYLHTRWRGSALAAEVDDATQEVFIALLRSGGALERADPAHGSGFRGLLYGVTRNVALHIERTRARRVQHIADAPVEPEHVAADDPTLSRVFDRSYALSIVRQARSAMALAAADKGAEATRRVDLLRLVFQEGLPIREIAKRWQADPARLHHDYARARQEFRAAIAAIVAGTGAGSAASVERECVRLLELLRS